MSLHRKTDLAALPLCLVCGALFLCQPAQAAQGFQSGVQLCLRTVVPALFPFFVLCDLLLACRLPGRVLRPLGRALGLQSPHAAAALLLSWFGGYAVCGRMTGRLWREGALPARDAALLLMLGCCSSPGFVVGCVGGLLLGSVQAGVLLYALQLAANLLATAVCLPLLPKAESARSSATPVPDARPSLPLALQSAADSCLHVCGCVVFFRMLGAVLAPLLPQHALAEALLAACLEISAGCAAFASLGGGAALYGCCLCLSVLGVSVWMQLALLLQRAVPLRLLAVNRLVHIVLLQGLVWLLIRFVSGAVHAASTLPARVIPMQRLPLDAALVSLCFVCAALYKVRQNFYNG